MQLLLPAAFPHFPSEPDLMLSPKVQGCCPGLGIAWGAWAALSVQNLTLMFAIY